MMLRSAAVVAGLALGLMSSCANAAYVINIDQINDNVVQSGTGSINLSGLTDTGSSASVIGTFQLDSAQLRIGSGTAEYFTGLQGPSSFGTGEDDASINTGGPFGIDGLDGYVFLPQGYTSNALLAPSTSTYSNTTLAKLGFRTGTITYTFGSGLDADSVSIVVGPSGMSPVPLPASAPMFGAALMALAGLGYGMNRLVAPKSKKAAAAA